MNTTENKEKILTEKVQTEFIETYLKPILEKNGYETNGHTWWKNRGDFYIVIHFQNSQWNNKDEFRFHLNIGVALAKKIIDKKNINYLDLATKLREDAYFSVERQKSRNEKDIHLGYKITSTTVMNEFISEFKIDLEENILKQLDQLITLKDCVLFYEKFDFWGNNLRQQIEECGLEVEV